MKQRTPKRPPRRKQTPDFPIRVTKLSHEGRGLVRWGERMLFIDGALPDELVSVRVTKKSSYHHPLVANLNARMLPCAAVVRYNICRISRKSTINQTRSTSS